MHGRLSVTQVLAVATVAAEESPFATTSCWGYGQPVWLLA